MMQKVTLVLGASQNPERYSYKAIRALKKNNHPVIAIGKRECTQEDFRILTGMPSGLGKIHTVTLYLSAKNQKEYLGYIISLRPQRIIFNPGTSNPELAKMAISNGIEVVDDCMLVMLNKGCF